MTPDLCEKVVRITFLRTHMHTVWRKPGPYKHEDMEIDVEHERLKRTESSFSKFRTNWDIKHSKIKPYANEQSVNDTAKGLAIPIRDEDREAAPRI